MGCGRAAVVIGHDAASFQHLAAHADAHEIVLQDDRSTCANLTNAFGRHDPSAANVPP